jgi:CheY-like chemotaxis protein
MQKKMLCVYDSVGMRSRLVSAIQKAVYNVLADHDGHDALAQIEKFSSQPGPAEPSSPQDGHTFMKNSAEKSGKETREKRMLVVDSSAPIFFAYRIQFERQGVIIDACETYDEAVELLKMHSYDVALMDVCQSGVRQKNNIDLISVLRRQRSDVKIILMTGGGNDDVRIRTEEMGVSFSFEKPVLSSTIFWALKELGITK